MLRGAPSVGGPGGRSAPGVGGRLAATVTGSPGCLGTEAPGCLSGSPAWAGGAGSGPPRAGLPVQGGAGAAGSRLGSRGAGGSWTQATAPAVFASPAFSGFPFPCWSGCGRKDRGQVTGGPVSRRRAVA